MGAARATPRAPGPAGAGGRGRGRGGGAAAALLAAAGALLRLGGAGVEAGAEAVWPEEAAGAASVTVFGAAVEEHWLAGGGWGHGLDVHCHFGTAKARAAPGSGGLLCRLPPLPPGFAEPERGRCGGRGRCHDAPRERCPAPARSRRGAAPYRGAG